MNKALETLSERGFIQQCTDIEGLSKLMDNGPITFTLVVIRLVHRSILDTWFHFLLLGICVKPVILASLS